ncbi:hypothetical protein [Inediibacterium massiliense]|uniref:hypothetical protein n=1 Tax=Inediibacterium massiliense TaxID=1658111 RepID=UPI0006B65331|nr:hypothetical protein [Inediibacterium massiliense]
MFYYAQLNENCVCIGISCLSGEIRNKRMIQIESMSEDFLWRKYEHGEWSKEKFELQSTSPLTEFEKTKQSLIEVENAIASLIGGAM